MSSSHTPSTQQIRERYTWTRDRDAQTEAVQGAAFDRWLESVRAEERERLDSEHMLRPRPWPPIPYPDDAAHQARWTIQRAASQAVFKTGDPNEGYMAAADALLAEGWQPPGSEKAVRERIAQDIEAARDDVLADWWRDGIDAAARIAREG